MGFHHLRGPFESLSCWSCGSASWNQTRLESAWKPFRETSGKPRDREIRRSYGEIPFKKSYFQKYLNNFL